MREPIVEVNLAPDQEWPAAWRVEATDADGGVHVALFNGAHAEEDARIFAGAAYPEVGFQIVAAPERRPSRQRPKLTIVGGTDARV